MQKTPRSKLNPDIFVHSVLEPMESHKTVAAMLVDRSRTCVVIAVSRSGFCVEQNIAVTFIHFKDIF